MKWAVYSPSENRNVEMKNSNKSSIVRIIAALLLMSLLSCSKVAETVAVPQHSNIFAKHTTSRIIIKGHQDKNSSKSKVSKQWDDNFISGSGHSTLGCD